jgi:hypothetical protein
MSYWTLMTVIIVAYLVIMLAIMLALKRWMERH